MQRRWPSSRVNSSDTRAEQSRLEGEQRYERLPASVTDDDYTVVFQRDRPSGTSPGAGCEAVTGHPQADFDAAPVLRHQMIHEEGRPAVLEQASQVPEGKALLPLEHRIVHRGGSIRWIRNVQLLREDGEGRPHSYAGLVSDSTTWRQTERAPRESQERLTRVRQGSNDGLWEWRLTTDEICFLPRWKRMTRFGGDCLGPRIKRSDASATAGDPQTIRAKPVRTKGTP